MVTNAKPCRESTQFSFHVSLAQNSKLTQNAASSQKGERLNEDVHSLASREISREEDARWNCLWGGRTRGKAVDINWHGRHLDGNSEMGKNPPNVGRQELGNRSDGTCSPENAPRDAPQRRSVEQPDVASVARYDERYPDARREPSAWHPPMRMHDVWCEGPNLPGDGESKRGQKNCDSEHRRRR